MKAGGSRTDSPSERSMVPARQPANTGPPTTYLTEARRQFC